MIWLAKRSSANRFSPAAKRGGYTLVEIAIVLAIMTALATASWPMLMKPWQRSIIQRDAEMLREAMQNARLSAISNGHVYLLQWKLGKNEFEIRSRDPVAPKNRTEFDADRLVQRDVLDSADTQRRGSSEIAGLSDDANAPRWNHQVLLKERLTDGVIFDAEMTSDPLAMEQDGFNPANDFGHEDRDRLDNPASIPKDPLAIQLDEPMHDRWSDPVFFHPNGRAENREITLHSEDGYSITISLRGFTGSATIGSPVKTQRPNADDQQIVPSTFDESSHESTHEAFPTEI